MGVELSAPRATGPQFMCPTHSKAKLTKTMDFRAEKGLSQEHARDRELMPARRQTAHAPQNLKLPKGFQQSIFKGKVRKRQCWCLQISLCRNPLFLQLSM